MVVQKEQNIYTTSTNIPISFLIRLRNASKYLHSLFYILKSSQTTLDIYCNDIFHYLFWNNQRACSSLLPVFPNSLIGFQAIVKKKKKSSLYIWLWLLNQTKFEDHPLAFHVPIFAHALRQPAFFDLQQRKSMIQIWRGLNTQFFDRSSFWFVKKNKFLKGIMLLAFVESQWESK